MASVRKRKWNHKGVESEAWVVSYTDQGGKRRIKTFDKKKDADKYRTTVEVEIENGMHVAPAESMNIAEVCGLFLNQCDQRVRDGIIGRGRYHWIEGAIRLVIVPNLGRVKLSELSVTQVEELYETMRTGGLAIGTARQRLVVFQQIQEFARKRKYLLTSPVTDVLTSLSRGRGAAPIRTFTSEDVVRILAAVKHRAPPNGSERTRALLECFVNVAAFCGLRWGEIGGLKVENALINQRVILVRNSISQHDGLKGPKSKAGIRDVPMPPHVAVMLADWLAKHHVKNTLGLVFCSRNGTMIRSGHFHQFMWGPLLKRSGLMDEKDRFHFHALRHFAASSFIEHGLPLTEVAPLLGHSTFDQTLQTYTHPIVGGHRRHHAIDRIAADLLASPVTIEADLIGIARDKNATTLLN